MRRALYRLRQGLANLGARMRPEDWTLAGRHLSDRELALFARMSTADQRHGVRVLRSLLMAGAGDPALLKAALLHDVGKSACRITVLHRTVAVLLGGLASSTLPILLGWPSHRFWLPFHVIANHSRIGASMLARAGCEERVWRLAELHQVDTRWLHMDTDGEWMLWALSALRKADNLN